MDQLQYVEVKLLHTPIHQQIQALTLPTYGHFKEAITHLKLQKDLTALLTTQQVITPLL